MKIEYQNGWFKVRQIVGRKVEVTFSTNSGKTFCENIRADSWAAAADYCKGRISS